MRYQDLPETLVRGEGVYLYDTEGRRYLDFAAGAPLAGHGHPEIVSAMAAQAATLNTAARCLTGLEEGYAARVLKYFPAPLERFIMTCSGGESVDLALRAARAVTGRRGIIVTQGASHGGLAAVDTSPALMGEELPSYVRTIPAPDPALAGGRALEAWFAAQVEEAATALAAAGEGVAALVLDSAFATDGVFVDPPGLWAAAATAVRRGGGLVIADETQTGPGRTGAMWAFLRHGVVPDIVTLGQALGNAYPMGGVVMRQDHFARAVERVPGLAHVGGSPVAAAAGLAMLDVIQAEGLLRNAVRIGDSLRRGLESLAQQYACLGPIRGAGLVLGFDVLNQDKKTPDPEGARRLALALRRSFVLTSLAGVEGQALRISPPLCVSASQTELFLTILGAALASVG